MTLRAKTVAALPALAITLVGVAGAAGIAYGAWLAYPPAGFMSGGGLLLTGAILLARAE